MLANTLFTHNLDNLCYEMKCITGVLVKKNINSQLIVGKYGTSSICSARMIRENLKRFSMCLLKLAIIGFYFTQYLII